MSSLLSERDVTKDLFDIIDVPTIMMAVLFYILVDHLLSL